MDYGYDYDTDNDEEEIDNLPSVSENPSKEEIVYAIQALTTCIVLSVEKQWENGCYHQFPRKPDLVVMVKRLITFSEPVRKFWPFNYEYIIKPYLQKMSNRIPELSALRYIRSFCDVMDDVYGSAAELASALGDLC